MKTRPLPLALAGTALVLLSAPLSGQQPLSELRPGQRVRVVVPGTETRPARTSTGNLVRLGTDTVFLSVGGGFVRPEVWAVSLSHDARFEIVTATRSHYREGALLGGLFAGMVGAAIASASWHECTSTALFDMGCLYAPTQGEATAGGFLVGGLAGALASALVGSGMRTETWTPVSRLPAKSLVPVRIVVAPLPAGRMGVGAAFSC